MSLTVSPVLLGLLHVSHSLLLFFLSLTASLSAMEMLHVYYCLIWLLAVSQVPWSFYMSLTVS